MSIDHTELALEFGAKVALMRQPCHLHYVKLLNCVCMSYRLPVLHEAAGTS